MKAASATSAQSTSNSTTTTTPKTTAIAKLGIDARCADFTLNELFALFSDEEERESVSAWTEVILKRLSNLPLKLSVDILASATLFAWASIRDATEQKVASHDAQNATQEVL